MNEPCWTQTIMFAPFLPSPPTAETPQEGGNGELARPEAYCSLRLCCFKMETFATLNPSTIAMPIFIEMGVYQVVVASALWE